MKFKEELDEIFGKYLLKIEQIQQKTNDAVKKLNRSYPIKFVFESTTKGQKDKKVNVISHDKLNILPIKSLQKVDLDDLDKIVEDEFDNLSLNDKTNLKSKLRYMLSNPEDFISESLNRLYILAIPGIFAEFESFNNQIIYLLNKLKGRDNKRKKSFHNIYQIRDQLKKLLKKDMEESFHYWSELLKFFNIRNVLVHKNGIIDDIFIENLNLNKKSLGKKITIGKSEFNFLIQVIQDYIKFIKNSVLEQFHNNIF